MCVSVCCSGSHSSSPSVAGPPEWEQGSSLWLELDLISGTKPRTMSMNTAGPWLTCSPVSEKWLPIVVCHWYFVMQEQLTDTTKQRLIRHIMSSQPRHEEENRLQVSKASCHSHLLGAHCMTSEQHRLSIWLWFLLMWGDYTLFRWLRIISVLAINLSVSIELSFEHRLIFNICSETRRQKGVMIKVKNKNDKLHE